MSFPVTNDLAGGVTDLGSLEPFQLLAGEKAPVTTSGLFLTTQVIPKYQTLGRITATGKLVILNPAGSDGSQILYAIAAQPMNTTTPAGDQNGPVYITGVFNHQALVWPAALDLFEERVTATIGTDIVVRKLAG